MYYDEEPYISEEQQRNYDLLVMLSDSITKEIEQNRNNAVESLISQQLLASKKKPILKAYCQTRIDFNNQRIKIGDSESIYEEVISLSLKLNSDNSFFGNDAPYVLNGLAFYENSISFEDVMLAFHNYRLGHEEEDLWWLSLLICRYIYNVLTMDSTCKNYCFECSDSIRELNKLAEYVIDFWNKYKYLKDTDVDTYKLSDDRKRDFYDKIDYDAGHFFASEDAENEEERKCIDAKYAADLISRCAKTMYLLLSTIKEIDDPEFSSVLKKLRRVVIEICDSIYRESDDAYGELENDNRINSAALGLMEKENEIKLLKLTLQSALDQISECSTEEMLTNRQDALRTVVLAESDELIEEFVKRFSERLMLSVSDGLDSYYDRLMAELGTKYDMLPPVALNALASAEYLYDHFVKKKAPEGFDYSGIAVLYFQAFETAYDTLLIEPYSKWLKRQEIDKLFSDKCIIQKKNFKKRTQEEKNRLSEIDTTLKEYFSGKFDKDLFYYKGEFVSSLEIGKFQRFIDLSDCISMSIRDKGNKLIKYLEEECFKKQIDSGMIKSFAQAVRNATTPRNKAAHGLYGLGEEDVRKDKIIIYDESNITDIQNFKNLLYAFLEFYN